MKPHKHADLIKAWADGAEIQVYTDTWHDDSSPLWRPNLEYRIKPKKPVVRYLWECDGYIINRFASEEEAVMNVGGRVFKRLDWSRTEFEK